MYFIIDGSKIVTVAMVNPFLSIVEPAAAMFNPIDLMGAIWLR